MARSMRTSPIRNWFFEQFAYRANAAVTEVIDIVHHADVLSQLEQYLIAETKSGASSVRLSRGVSRPILMLNFKRPTRLKSYFARVKEHAAEKVRGGFQRRRIAGAQLAVDLDERFFRRTDGVLIQGAREHQADLVALGEEHIDFRNAAFGKRLPQLGSQRLVGLQQNFASLSVDHIGDAV